MQCPAPERWFELADPSARGGLELHLDGCDDCRELVAALATAQVLAPATPAGPAADGPGWAPELAIHGEKIDRYVVHRGIGAGGMGVVLAAYDPALERTVALKLVRVLDRSPAAIARARERLIAEAKAMARLAHPNVVAIHEVVSWGDELFIAMERVDGPDLATWLAEAPRTRAEKLRVVLEAGRGIVAAHAAGLVHRDVKPANVLIGGDGRARITDLGLAAVIAEAEGGALRLRAASPRCAQDERGIADGSPSPRCAQDERAGGGIAEGSPASRLVGTPGFLAPEVIAGARGDARADQYAYAVTVSRVLGEQGRIGRVLARGKAARPEDRFPSMQVLVDELERASRPRWPRFAVAGLVVVAAALGAAWWRERDRPAAAATCSADPTVGGTWTAARRAGLEIVLAARDESPDRRLTARTLEVVDARAGGWSAAVVDTCTARVRGTQSAELADRRGACLEDHRRQLAAVLAAVGDRTKPGRALSAVGSLPLAEACSVPPAAPATDDPAHRRTRAELTAIVAVMAVGRYVDATILMSAVIATAPTDDLQLAGEIAYRRADLALRSGDAQAALPLIHDAVALAERAHDDAARVDAMTELVVVLDELGRNTEARALIPLLEAAAARQTLAVADTTRLEAALGNIAYNSGEYVDAERHYRAALAAAERRYGGVAPAVAGNLEAVATALHAQARGDEAREVLARSVAMFEATVGPNHPDVALPLLELGDLAFENDELDTAAGLFQRAIDIWTAALGPDHPYLCEALGHLGRVEWARENDDRALALHRRSLAIAEAGFGPGHPLAAVARYHIAKVYEERGDLAGARDLAEAAVKVWDETGVVIPDAHDSRFMLARLLWSGGDRKRARALAEAARAGYAAMNPPYDKTATTIATWLAEHPAGAR